MTRPPPASPPIASEGWQPCWPCVSFWFCCVAATLRTLALPEQNVQDFFPSPFFLKVSQFLYMLGSPRFVANLSPVLFSVAGLLTFLAGEKLYNERVGFYACLGVLTLPFVSHLSRFLNEIAFFLPLSAAAVYLLACFWRKASALSAALLGICLGLMVVVDLKAGSFLILGAGVAFLPGVRERLLRREMLLCPLFASLTFLTLAIVLFRQTPLLPDYPTFSALFIVAGLLPLIPLPQGIAVLGLLYILRPWPVEREDHLLLLLIMLAIAVMPIQYLMRSWQSGGASLLIIPGVLLLAAMLLRRGQTFWLKLALWCQGIYAVLSMLWPTLEKFV